MKPKWIEQRLRSQEQRSSRLAQMSGRTVFKLNTLSSVGYGLVVQIGDLPR
ncbi:MAG TPA: hypothetical protein V6C84_04090 [Coleofasciculaceae cyanobacterium]|jgi:hypothetical protein